jgi:hypothetical protein
MRKHDLDATSLVAGLVFVGIAVAYLIGAFTSTRIEAGWILPIGLVGLGLAGLAGSLVRIRRVEPAEAQQVDAEPSDAEQPPQG